MSDLIVDISNNNGRVDLRTLKAVWGIKAVIAKASQGDYFTDGQFGSNRAQAKRLNLPFGAYHFYDPKVHPERQAEHFVAIVQKLHLTDIRPVLDYELGGLPSAEAYAAIRAFNGVVKDKLGRYPIFYSDRGFIEALGLPRPVGNGLWLADFGPDDGSEHSFSVPHPWKKSVLHQFTSKAHAGGKQFDLSYGKLRALLAYPYRATLAGRV